MKSRIGRSWVTRIGVAALFTVFGVLGSCDTDSDGLTGVGPQQSEVPQQTTVPVRADSTHETTKDDCYWVDGQWICPS